HFPRLWQRQSLREACHGHASEGSVSRGLRPYGGQWYPRIGPRHSIRPMLQPHLDGHRIKIMIQPPARSWSDPLVDLFRNGALGLLSDGHAMERHPDII